MATREEKIKEILDSTGRQEKVDRMLDEVESWDTHAMVDWIQHNMRNILDDMSDAEIRDEYESYFESDFADIEDDDDDDELFYDDDCEDCSGCEYCEEEDEREAECVCEWEVVYQQGCQCGGR